MPPELGAVNAAWTGEAKQPGDKAPSCKPEITKILELRIRSVDGGCEATMSHKRRGSGVDGLDHGALGEPRTGISMCRSRCVEEDGGLNVGGPAHRQRCGHLVCVFSPKHLQHSSGCPSTQARVRLEAELPPHPVHGGHEPREKEPAGGSADMLRRGGVSLVIVPLIHNLFEVVCGGGVSWRWNFSSTVRMTTKGRGNPPTLLKTHLPPDETNGARAAKSAVPFGPKMRIFRPLRFSTLEPVRAGVPAAMTSDIVGIGRPRQLAVAQESPWESRAPNVAAPMTTAEPESHQVRQLS